MKVVYKNEGSNVFAEFDPVPFPQLGWEIKMFDQRFKIIGIFHDKELPDDEIEVILSKVPQRPEPIGKQVQVIKVWQQNEKSLTLNKVYEIVRETERNFTIIDNEGREKKYKHDNNQFRKL